MKKNKMAMVSVTFILGAVFGISLFALLSFVRTPNPPLPNPLLNPIQTAEANRLFHYYYDSATSLNAKIEGFYVDRPQLEALNELAKNTALVGFRIYLGKTAPASKDTLSIIVGVTSKMLDDVPVATGVNGKIYRTESRKAGPCPPMCDRTSPITK
jgi:hypothetical protein